MDKTTLGLLTAMSALAALDGSQAAAVRPVDRAQSVAELLEPIPNAAARLQLVLAAEVGRVAAEAKPDDTLKRARRRRGVTPVAPRGAPNTGPVGTGDQGGASTQTTGHSPSPRSQDGARHRDPPPPRQRRRR